jgi:hypothetical protein
MAFEVLEDTVNNRFWPEIERVERVSKWCQKMSRRYKKVKLVRPFSMAVRGIGIWPLQEIMDVLMVVLQKFWYIPETNASLQLKNK